LGQHFLVDDSIAHRIVEIADLRPDDVVVEVGPGFGALTFLLTERAQKVIAIELDTKIAGYLRNANLRPNALEIIEHDALQFDFAALANTIGRQLKVVANLPYNISTPLLFRLLEMREVFARFVLMLQREVADRIVATPGRKTYGPLSVFTQLFTVPCLQLLVPPRAFYPRPRVESAVVSFDIRRHAAVEIDDLAFFRRVVHECFSRRRKTILNALTGSSSHAGTKQDMRRVLTELHIDPHRRGETLGLDEFRRLAQRLRKQDETGGTAPA
jgi:16S rRNA (adenine1518-N6/adenine1519-N6)-dimethyltransferase